MAIHSSILAWKILWTEEPGGLQSIGSQRVRHDLATKQQQHPNLCPPLKTEAMSHSFLGHYCTISDLAQNAAPENVSCMNE